MPVPGPESGLFKEMWGYLGRAPAVSVQFGTSFHFHMELQNVFLDKL